MSLVADHRQSLASRARGCYCPYRARDFLTSKQIHEGG